ncbi:hypothetical protein [Pseudoteredinibacter isoporae]|uniref:Flagellar hook-associated protein FlgK n=1 Tax=Pseudoteredinibacter isoporae TaxID=570281 RepID=A0A7X0JRP2_9GAMM|nr:hypothetical protein [Pseudoteredinibacter isoporae]MBB6521049.1 flagellar hook-associated protein FlgK [Pseudoteredinibacter isoporae]NHO86613.1 hypothetical protein [Pseudoteredinibacter isoporae]NIB24935.1 hypothetical protein [Pseudoteredinibacter isoporae]
MNISSGNSFSIAQQGLQRSQASAVEAAESIANPARFNPAEEAKGVLEPLAEPIVQLKESQQLFDASAKVIEVSNRTVGALLDISA